MSSVPSPLIQTYTWATIDKYKDEDLCIRKDSISEASEKLIIVPGYIDRFKPDPIGKIIINTHEGVNPYALRERSKYSLRDCAFISRPAPGSYSHFVAPTGQIILYLWCMENGFVIPKHVLTAMKNSAHLLKDKSIAIPCGWPVSLNAPHYPGIIWSQFRQKALSGSRPWRSCIGRHWTKRK